MPRSCFLKNKNWSTYFSSSWLRQMLNINAFYNGSLSTADQQKVGRPEQIHFKNSPPAFRMGSMWERYWAGRELAIGSLCFQRVTTCRNSKGEHDDSCRTWQHFKDPLTSVYSGSLGSGNRVTLGEKSCSSELLLKSSQNCKLTKRSSLGEGSPTFRTLWPHGSLVGCRLWGRTESDMTEAT